MFGRCSLTLLKDRVGRYSLTLCILFKLKDRVWTMQFNFVTRSCWTIHFNLSIKLKDRVGRYSLTLCILFKLKDRVWTMQFNFVKRSCWTIQFNFVLHGWCVDMN